MGLSNQKMATEIVLDVSNNFYCTTVQGVKWIGDHRVKSQTPGIMTRLPMKAAVTGPGLPV